MHSPTRVLFVCDGSAARSQMAEGLLRTLGGSGFEVHSAGLVPEGLHPLAIEVMKEIDIDISGQGVHHLNDFEEVQFDYVISLCDEARESCLAFPRDGHNLHWQSDDPTEAPASGQASEEATLAAFRRTRDQLRQQIGQWLPEVPPSKG